MLERWHNIHNFFRQEFVIAETKREETWIKSVYHTKFCSVLTHIREFKSATLTSRALEFNFNWKLSFPNVHNLKSFVVSQHVVVDALDPIIKIYVLTRKPSDHGSYLQDVFYE